MRAPRSVTLQPTCRPSRTLKVATDLLALLTSGFWPVILVRSPAASSMTFLSATASPTPMLTVILVMRGTCMLFLSPRSCPELRHDAVAIMLVQSCLRHFCRSPSQVSTTSSFDLKKRTLPSASVDCRRGRPSWPPGSTARRSRSAAAPPFDDAAVRALSAGSALVLLHHVDVLDQHAAVVEHVDDGAAPALVAAGVTTTSSPFRSSASLPPSKDFRRQRNDLHELRGAQLARHRPEDARADRLELVGEQHRRVAVEADQRAVAAARRAGCAPRPRRTPRPS